MSTQVTVHRMVTTTTTSAVLLNIGYVKSLPGILKVFQIVLSCIAIGIIGHYITSYSRTGVIVPELFFLLIATTCLICTSLLLLSCLCSIATSSIMPRTLFEAMYHTVACLLYFAAGICLVIHLKDNEHYESNFVAKMSAGVCGLVNTALYALSSFYSIRSFRRGG